MKPMKKLQLSLIGLSGLAAATTASAQTTTIGFDSCFNLSGNSGGNGTPFTTCTEKGFTFTAPAGQYVQSTKDGVVSNNALLTGVNNGQQVGQLTVTGPTSFVFNSLQAKNSGTTLDIFAISGYQGATRVYNYVTVHCRSIATPSITTTL